MALDLPPADIRVPPRPAIIRPAEHSILRPGYFRPVSRDERRAIIADLMRSGRLTRDDAKKAFVLVPVAAWPASAGGGDGNDAYTVLLLHFDGADTSTTFTDSSSSGHSFTVYGNAQIDTAQSKFGGSSGRFDGAGDYIVAASSTDFALPGDLTVDFWVRWNSHGSGARYVFSTGIDDGLAFNYDNGGTWQPTDVYKSFFCTWASSASTGVWYHVALVRSGSTFYLFVDGTQRASVTKADSFLQSGMYIGTYKSTVVSAPTAEFNGWIDEFRVSKGIARWTSNFTPPSAPYS